MFEYTIPNSWLWDRERKIQSLIDKYDLKNTINLYDATDNLEYFYNSDVTS